MRLDCICQEGKYVTIRIMNAVISLLLFLASFLFLVAPVQAHMGGGPPFLKINDTYAQTNPYYQGQLTLTIPQDNAPKSYLVGRPIQLAIDVNALTKQTTIPPEFARKLTFRWYVATGDNFDVVSKEYKYESAVTYTFPKPQSYLIIIEAKAPSDTDYITLDTVQLNVLPASSYKLPDVSVVVGTQHADPQKSVLLVSQTRFDQSVTSEKYLWDFNDGKLSHGLRVERTFDAINDYGIGMIYHRVIDDKGFIADIGFTAEKVQGRLAFAPFGNMTTIPLKVVSYDEAQIIAQTKPNDSHKNAGMYLIIFFIILSPIVTALVIRKVIVKK